MLSNKISALVHKMLSQPNNIWNNLLVKIIVNVILDLS